MKNWIMVLLIIALFLGVFLFIYGGYDDSPGAQGLGLIFVFTSIFVLSKRKKG